MFDPSGGTHDDEGTLPHHKHLFRRFVHMACGLSVVAVLFPETAYWDTFRVLLVVFVLFVAYSIEGVRLATGSVIFGMRSYEKDEISGIVWAATGTAIALFSMDVLVPRHVVAAILLGLAFMDPYMGEMRAHYPKGYPVLPVFVYMALFMLVTLAFGEDPRSLVNMLYIVLGSVFAVVAEYPRIEGVDDNFLMVVVPLVVCALVGM